MRCKLSVMFRVPLYFTVWFMSCSGHPFTSLYGFCHAQGTPLHHCIVSVMLRVPLYITVWFLSCSGYPLLHCMFFSFSWYPPTTLYAFLSGSRYHPVWFLSYSGYSLLNCMVSVMFTSDFGYHQPNHCKEHLPLRMLFKSYN